MCLFPLKNTSLLTFEWITSTNQLHHPLRETPTNSSQSDSSLHKLNNIFYTGIMIGDFGIHPPWNSARFNNTWY